MNRLELQDKIIKSFYKDKRILVEGQVKLPGISIETSRLRVTDLTDPLVFIPRLEDIKDIYPRERKILSNYLVNYRPVHNDRLIFYPDAQFDLIRYNYSLILGMQENENWKKGEVIELFNKSLIEKDKMTENFNEYLDALSRRMISSFTFGRLQERIDYPDFILLRKYSKE